VPVADGEVEVEPEVVLPEVVLDPAGVVELVVGELAGEVALVVVDEELELVLEGVQDPETYVVPRGRGTCCGVVPGGALTVSVCVPPVRVFTVTVHTSADAGTLPNASNANRALASASTETSLRRRVKTALLLRPSCSSALQA
jgi:hypothetical protein